MKTLWHPEFEKDSCGVGFVADVSGKPSHKVLRMGIQGVCCVTHRGAVSADAKTGDGAGVLTQIPRKLFARELVRLGHPKANIQDVAVGVFFLPQNPSTRMAAKGIVDRIVREQGLMYYGWREVPVNPDVLGDKALSTMPAIQHLVVGRPAKVSAGPEYERLLYYTRRLIERALTQARLEECYIPSFSSRTIVYKGLFVAPQLAGFYEDLADPTFETAIALFHQRYSTNTFPNWILAQPFRFLGHNGEINTLLGNRNWMRAREPELKSPVWGGKIQDLVPVIQPGGSDSAMLDNVLELLVSSDYNILHAMTMLIPEAWQNMPGMEAKVRAFYEFQACLSEPWDGPAAVAFSDGVIVGATLDRNGLRPARYKVTRDGFVILGSEVGIIDIDESQVLESGRLGPGQMLAVDTARKKVLRGEQIKHELASRKPYAAWLQEQIVRPDTLKLNEGKLPVTPLASTDQESLLRMLKACGLTQEDLQFLIKPMAETGKESVGSMGDDAPLAILSTKPRIIATYFKQLFAQVTNPPIDPLREKLVMSLNTGLGARGSMLEENPEHAKWIKFSSPILTESELKWLETLSDPAFKAIRLPTLFLVSDGPGGLEKAIRRLCDVASAAVDAGNSILILTDRGIDATHAALPIQMAAGAVHHFLIRQGKRMRASLICETAQVWDMHHDALLIGYGVAAIHPYAIFQTIAWMFSTGMLKEVTLDQAWANYKKAIEDGILKIMSKMGISTIASYRGGQIFEAIGLNEQVIDTCFAGTISRIGGVGFTQIGKDILTLHASAYAPGGVSGAASDSGSRETESTQLDQGGFYRFRRDGEKHAFSPQVLDALHVAVHSNDSADYATYSNLVNNREPICLRDLLEFSSDRTPIPLEEVESVEVIRKRFCTAGMSYGALSKETHECLAVALNRIGGKSNSGEGGEDPIRFKPLPNGDSANSAIKQVASGRFGVTPEYLASARELEIKMAQGSKPGEGGQLPGFKVSEEIARVRHSTPGVTLISPPPHHDIYSIEDLAQLIYDLKMANAKAKVCVKLVAEAGVGTIAAGVAKGYADVVHIAGHDGGTGASPISSIKNAGSPWELGVAETQQVLVMNDLRGRIVVRTDGGLKTGRDILVAALFGAEEYNFGTAALVAAGCCMVRQCHLNTCPVGVATQDPKLRAKFKSPPDFVVNFFTLIAQEVREFLSKLGYRSMDDLIGRVDLLKVKPMVAEHPKWSTIDWSALLADPDPSGIRPRRCLIDRNDREETIFDEQILKEVQPALEGRGRVTLRYPIKNHQRSIGTRLSYEIAIRYGDSGLPGGSFIECQFTGSAGQSFGAFLSNGMRLMLTGEANDYVGKGMHGGEIVIKPSPRVPAQAESLVLVGNTVMYGATGGTLYVNGRAGERFCVRNSGGKAIVEGMGDHGCEYMTGGVVVIMGSTGRNFGAGMTGGLAFVYDPEGIFPQKYNPALVELHHLEDPEDQDLVKSMILRHAELTGSPKAQELLSNWEQVSPFFWKVNPKKEVVKLEAAVGTPLNKPIPQSASPASP